MVTETVNATKTFGSGASNQTFDLGGVTYKRGTSLGDKQVVSLTGMGNILRNFKVDDSGLSGVSGAVSLGGTDCRIEDAELDNCIRYGFIFGFGALRCTYRRLTIKKCQHGISGSSGSTGEWNSARIQTDCIIEDCDISGMQIDGIKLKQMLRTIVRRNKIDVYPKYPEISSKSGIYFAGSDTASKDCIIENNTIYQSAPTPAGVSVSRAMLINADQTVAPTVVSSGNKIRNNVMRDMKTGVWLRPNTKGWYLEANQMIGVATPYDNDGANNTIIPYVPPPPDPCQPYKEQVATLQGQLTALNNMITGLNAEVTALNEEVDSQTASMQGLASQIQVQESVIGGLKAKMDSARSVLIY